ncbi:aspartyl/asparaginyl beta-hydroxylase domain-containing protein [Pleurocapsa sp. PCC 7319]|uniref:aspartyl/asparaginyl beta-hydroxylase domain-containing protein n=1 Tax=Pleurocapsa sp. PCC 7319 TaxID=118161 RepID=UPI00034DE9EF|nr:aspartyl/asparaginyl beta-hydroxylase domain-containing protein [Pleurocapsa sp. PCC 7319]
MKTFVTKLRNKKARVVSFYQLIQYLFEVSRDIELHPILRSYAGNFPLCLFSDPLVWLKMVRNAESRFLEDKQRPYAFYATHLRAIPFGEPDRISKFLEDNLAAIAREFSRCAPPEVPTPSKALVDQGIWNTFPLRRSSKTVPENISRCPQTWSLVQKCPLLQGVEGGVYFSIVYPGTHISSHCGPSNLKHRYHLTIEEAEGAKIRAGDKWRTWRRGECLILDDSFEHEVKHNGDKRRVVLIVDCWHPDLTEKERDFLTNLHRIWQKPTRKAAEKQGTSRQPREQQKQTVGATSAKSN